MFWGRARVNRQSTGIKLLVIVAFCWNKIAGSLGACRALHLYAYVSSCYCLDRSAIRGGETSAVWGIYGHIQRARRGKGGRHRDGGPDIGDPSRPRCEGG